MRLSTNNTNNSYNNFSTGYSYFNNSYDNIFYDNSSFISVSDIKNKDEIKEEWKCYTCLELFYENPAISCTACNDGKICEKCFILFLKNNTKCGICRTPLDYQLFQVKNNNHEPIEYRRYVSVITKIISHSSIIFINIIFNLIIFMKYLTECENNSSILINNIIVNNIVFSSSNIVYYLVSKYYFNNTAFYIKMLLFHIVFSNLYFVIYYYIVHKINCSIIHSEDILISYLETEILKLLYLFFYCIFS